MDIDQLNHMLSKLSQSEIRYQNGGTYNPFRERGDHIDRPIADFPSQTVEWISAHGTPTMQDTRYILAQNDLRSFPLAGVFGIKQNSRFNPVPLHTHDFIEMSYVYTGTCPQEVDGHRVTLRENQVLLLDTNCPHSIDALGQNDIMLSVLFSKDFLRNTLLKGFSRSSILAHFFVQALNEQTDQRRYIRFHSQSNRQVRCFFQELMCEYFDPSTNADQIVLLLLQLIFAELINVYESDFDRREKSADTTLAVEIVRYIEKNFLTCTLEGVAEQFYISPNYVSKLLKRHTGMSYIQAVQAQRLGRAASLLRNTQLPVAEIARQTGYENQSFFYRKFKAQFGCLPAEYRARS